MSDAICHVMIRGRVQGVGYRYWVEQKAMARSLEGWVRNRRDGSVEAVFAGPADAVSGMIAFCGRGPGPAPGDAVAEEPADTDVLRLRRPEERFSVLPTI